MFGAPLREITGMIRRRRSSLLTAFKSYALSPRTDSGRRLGRPGRPATGGPATLTEVEKLHRKAVLASAADLTSLFAEMLTTLDGLRLPKWITEAVTSGLPGISTFAAGLESDFDAVTAGLTTDWNSGPVEGAVNRIKMLKRHQDRRMALLTVVHPQGRGRR